jgi:hypothetical protein
MKKAEARAAIAKELADITASAGFAIRSGTAGIKSEKCALRKIPDERQTIGIVLYDYNRTFQFQFSFVTCVRIDRVEAIRHLIYETASKYHGMSDTLMMPFRLFSKGPPTFEVNTESEIKTAMSDLIPTFHQHIFPFLARYRDIAALDQGMNRDGNIPQFGNNWAMSATILACLADNPQYLAIVSRYRKDMQSANEFDRSKYEKLVEYLQQTFAKQA